MMEEQFNDQLRQQFDTRLNPFRKGVTWRLTLVEGIIALALALLAILFPQFFSDALGAIFGGYLLIISILSIITNLKAASAGAVQPFNLIRGGIGLLTGIITVLQPFLSTIDRLASFTVLAIGLGLYGIFGLVGLFVLKQAHSFGVVIANALPLGVAAVIAYSLITGTSTVDAMKFLLIIAGVLLLGYSFMLYNQQRSTAAPAAPSAPPAPKPTKP
jgi:uncharacterized membrane protein HdeD (DUF308 family)